jgi:hypothetical protein
MRMPIDDLVLDWHRLTFSEEGFHPTLRTRSCVDSDYASASCTESTAVIHD